MPQKECAGKTGGLRLIPNKKMGHEEGRKAGECVQPIVTPKLKSGGVERVEIFWP